MATKPEQKSRREMTELWRSRIEVGTIITKLGKLMNGEIEMSTQQMKAAEILLRKTLPDLTATDLTTKGDNISFTMQIGKPKK